MSRVTLGTNWLEYIVGKLGEKGYKTEIECELPFGKDLTAGIPLRDAEFDYRGPDHCRGELELKIEGCKFERELKDGSVNLTLHRTVWGVYKKLKKAKVEYSLVLEVRKTKERSAICVDISGHNAFPRIWSFETPTPFTEEDEDMLMCTGELPETTVEVSAYISEAQKTSTVIDKLVDMFMKIE